MHGVKAQASGNLLIAAINAPMSLGTLPPIGVESLYMKTARPYDELKVDRIPENRCVQVPIVSSGFLAFIVFDE
jgi:hypothetical protein